MAGASAAAVAAMEPSFFVRRADPDDIDTICAMYERTYQKTPAEWFANFHGLDAETMKTASSRQKFFVSLIETCFMSVTVEDDEGNIAGFAALDDVPIQMTNAPNEGTLWEEWFKRSFALPEILPENSLWIVCCLADLEAQVMGEILRTTFSTMPDLQHLLVLVPGGMHGNELETMKSTFSAHFSNLELVAGAKSPDGHWTVSKAAQPSALGHKTEVLMSDRTSIVNPLCIRMARVEDHDNLAAVFDAQSEVVTQTYGEYFIAELIAAQNEINKALVAEMDGRAVGLMCLTSDVDVNVLAQCFQLDPYDNLLKPDYMRRLREHAQAMAEGREMQLCSLGDYMQAALASIDLEDLLRKVTGQEDGRGGSVALFGALQQHEFAGEVGDALEEFDKAVMIMMWQACWWEPMLETSSVIDPNKVAESVQTFLELDITSRKEIAAEALEKWPEVLEILRSTREAMMNLKLAEAEQEGEAKPEDAEDAGLEEEAEDERIEIELSVFLKAMCDEEEGPFTRDFIAKLVMCLHWWADAKILNPAIAVPEDGFQSELEKIANSEEGIFVGNPNSTAWLTNMPQHSKDVFCVNMCCLDQAYQTQALDFLLPAFSLYPDKDYCVITQPHTAPNTPLLNAFTIVPPQPHNTFGHVLYLIHRAALLGPPTVRYMTPADLSVVPQLIENFDADSKAQIISGCSTFLEQDPSEPGKRTVFVFVAEFDEQAVALVTLRTPTSDVVDTLRCCYHLDDYLLVAHHEQVENKGHAQLMHYVVNPLFHKYTRRLLQGAMRMCGRTVFYMEVDLQQKVPSIIRQMLQVAPRRPPQLKKVPRQPPTVLSFHGVEKEVETEEDRHEKLRQALLRNKEQTKGLSLVAKKLLSETKIPVNARVVVVGASDCGLSFLESLLSIPHLLFNSLTLLAPGGLEYHHSHHLPLVAGTAAYSHHELRRIMLELRVRILDSRMVQIDREQRCCILHDGSMLPYDYLIVAAGLQDDALHSLRIRSWGVEHVTDGYRRVNGAISVADPSIRDLLVEGGTLIKSLIWNPLSYAVVYGRSLHAYCVVQGLLLRKVPPTKIILVLPPRLADASQQLPVDAFVEGDEVESKIHQILASMGVKLYEGYQLLNIQQDNRERLKALILEEHTGAPRTATAATSDDSSQHTAKHHEQQQQQLVRRGPEAAKARCGVLEDIGITARGLPQKMLSCRIIITADSVNVDPDIFNSVHGNGLVYDGRLIVDQSFSTTDDAIFGAGSLCEFSRRFQRKSAARYLRHDGFNGREVGSKLAHALLRKLDPVNGGGGTAGGPTEAGDLGSAGPELGAASPDASVGGGEGGGDGSSPELLPEFYMPIAKAGLLPGNLHYYRIHACRRGELRAEQSSAKTPEQIIVTDTVDLATGNGHFCRLTVDSFGKVDSITYLGGEELQVESLWSLVGLSETFLNHLFVRWRDGDIPDIVEFLTDEWATALFHDRFMDFCQQIKLELHSQDEVKKIINDALQEVDLKEGLSRRLLQEIRAKLPKDSVKAMQDHLLDYLRQNTNHLKTYFLPENWAGEDLMRR